MSLQETEKTETGRSVTSSTYIEVYYKDLFKRNEMKNKIPYCRNTCLTTLVGCRNTCLTTFVSVSMRW